MLQKKKINNTVKIDAVDKKNLINSCVKWTIKNCVPFSAPEGEGFKDVVREILTIGSKYGANVDVDHTCYRTEQQ